MRFFKATLRALIMLVSMFSFLGGWILLAHSLKPVSNSSSSSSTTSTSVIAVTPLPTLAPLAPIGSQQSQITQPIQQNSFSFISPPPQPQVQAMPMFSTSGS